MILDAKGESDSQSKSFDRKYNFVSCLIDAVGWPLGMAFFSTVTVIPALMGELDANNRLVGALVSLINLFVFLPGFLIVAYIGKLPRVRGYLLLVALAERFALIPLIPLTLLWGRPHPGWLLSALFTCLCLNALFMGLNQPAYWIVLGKCIPVNRRGRLFGVAGGLAGILGIGVDKTLHKLLSGAGGGFPGGYAEAFTIGFVIMTVSVLPLGFVREGVSPARTEGDAHSGHYWRDSKTVLRSSPGFKGFLVSQVPFNLVGLATPFFVLYATRKLGALPESLAVYTAVLVLASSFGSVVWGAWSDSRGNKVVMAAGSVCLLLGSAAALAAGTPGTFTFVFLLSALGGSAAMIAGNNIVLEYASAERDIPLYNTMYNLATVFPRTVAPLVGGLLADQAGGYRVVFMIATALAIFSVFCSLGIKEPRNPVNSRRLSHLV